MIMKYAYIYETKLGKVMIAQDGDSISKLDLRDEIPTDDYLLGETPLLHEASKQLLEYLDGKREQFTVKLRPEGTDFQKKVWEVLKSIPYGTTVSYGEVAKAVGNPKACRAVGMANNKNPIMIMIPCHRVIGANGKLVGYGGGLEIKEWLLSLEKERKASNE
jgi:methylated-DNA-[protein]-cysteine S-methyltransferase